MPLQILKRATSKFFYKPVHQYGLAEDYVLSDIFFEEPHYTQIIDLQIDSSFIVQDGTPLFVKVQNYDDILGDKLTAFAPNTTGIPYEKHGDSLSMEIIKQLYDIGSLLNFAADPAIVTKTFEIFAQTELGYRNYESDTQAVLEDIYQTALHICTRGIEGKGNYNQLLKGIEKVKRFIFSENYYLDRAIIDAAKAAYLSKSIEHKIVAFEKYKDIEQVKDLIIDQPFNTKHNKLKKANPEAFFYWYHISILENNII